MTYHRRRLPHLYETGIPIFITWRLHGSLPQNRSFPPNSLTSGQAFATLDRQLDSARTGPVHLRQPEIANMMVEAIHYNGTTLGHYTLHAFTVMPNHVHLLLTPQVPLPLLTKSLKNITAKRANATMARIGVPFWQNESYDHMIRDTKGFEKIQGYIEENPLRAVLVTEACKYPWSSATRQQETAEGREQPDPAQLAEGLST
jgi:putative transposase